MASSDKKGAVEKVFSTALLEGVAQANDPHYERFGVLIPCGHAETFTVDGDTLEALKALPYIRITILTEGGSSEPSVVAPGQIPPQEPAPEPTVEVPAAPAAIAEAPAPADAPAAPPA